MTVAYTFDSDSISDLHKDAYGMRPGPGFWENWHSATDDQRQEEWDWLIRVMERRIEEERQAEADSAVRFEQRVEETIALGARNRETAIQWIMDADDATDLEHLCWINGLSFNYFRKVA